MHSDIQKNGDASLMSKARAVYMELDSYLLILVIAMHAWAIFAFQIPVLRDIFLPLTPLTLIIAAIVAYRSYQGGAGKVFLLFFSIFSLGFLVEMLGVNTGFPFGSYSYGTVLGPKIMGTPVIIGLNWFILFSGIVYILNLVKIPKIGKALFGALLITGIDILIEPVAIYLGFWEWKFINPPAENYLGWFTVGFIMFMVNYVFFNSLKVTRKAFWVVVIFVLFFVLQNLIL